MAKKKIKEPEKGLYGEQEQIIAGIIVNDEYSTAKQNNSYDYSKFDALIDMLEGIRGEKNYDWESDINIPLIPSHLLTDAASWTTYFQTRDFVEVYLEGEPGDKPKCQAVKKLINKTLNMKEMYHFHKFMRMRMINWLYGNATALCYWEKDIEIVMQPQPAMKKVLIDENGEQIIVSEPQPDIPVKKIIVDRFNYEPLDPRNVFLSPEYCYSIQQKKYVIIRSEKSYEDLVEKQEQNGYFNLDLVKARMLSTAAETDTSKETYNKNDNKQLPSKTPIKTFDYLERFGKFWMLIEERNEDGIPIKAKPGISSTGEILDDAVLYEAIIGHAIIAGTPILVRFQPTFCIDSNNRTYRPLIRSWCYIHPTKDTGLSDGKNLEEIQVGVNDTFNVSNTRVMLATHPTMKVRKGAMDDNPTIYVEPNHLIELEDIDRDLKELEIRDNIGGAWTQLNALFTFASQLDSVWPGTMGGVPDDTSITATATASSDTRTNQRQNLKTLTYEWTCLIEQYWLINQMTWRFAEDETLFKLMGELTPYFDPDADYTYVPLSQSLESEHNKIRKVGVLDQMMGRVVGLAKIFPKEVAMVVAKIIATQMTLMGNEYQDIAGLVEAMAQAKPQQEGQEGATQISDGGSGIPMSNQNGIPMSGQEMDARGI